MFRNMKLRTKLTGGFGLMVILAATLGYMGWSSLRSVQRANAAAEAAGECISITQDAAVQRRQFMLSGFEKNAATGKTAEESWREAYARLDKQLNTIAGSSDFDAHAQEGIREAQKIAQEYSTQFGNLTQARRGTDDSFAAWTDLGWKITGKIGAAMEEQIDPARTKAIEAKDVAELARWDEIGYGLDEDVTQNFFLLRLRALVLRITNTDEAWQGFQDQTQKTGQGLAKWQALVAGRPELEAAATQLVDFFNQYKAGGQKYYDALVNIRTADTALITGAKAITEQCRKLQSDQQAQAAAVMSRSVTTMLTLAVAGVVLGAVLALTIVRAITKPINRIISGLTEGASQVTDAAGQVSTAAQSLAAGASEQASSLEETSAALEEMAAMTRTSAENAKQATQLSDQTRQAAETGDKTTQRLNSAMDSINESASQISKIIKVIEEIAFQTNLLALNAAVEAARAGEHGKGFAVVADEVRNLAMRAAEAARETTALIEGSVTRAKEGTQVAGEVAKALSGIVGDATKVSDLINGIARAAQEQAQGVDQVNVAVSQMDKVTQQNAATAEESASAAEQLAAQAQTVNGMVADLQVLVHGRTALVDLTERRTQRPQTRRPTASNTPPPPPAAKPTHTPASEPAMAAASETVGQQGLQEF